MASSSSTSAPSPSPSPSWVDSLFQRSLDDLIKALRASPAGEPSVLERSLAEIRREIRSADPDTKALALQKLAYLSSVYHVDMAFAGFPALELLPSSNLAHKRLAYLAASLSFHPSVTDVLPLATHQLRKDLSPSAPPAVAALALHLLALAASPDLARHLAPDLAPLLSPSSPRAAALRPKAAAAALRALALTPDAVPVLFKPLVDCLSAPDPRAVSAAVSAFCELAVSSADASPYLPLAPEFYRILLESRNNWILIKVLKIFARLAPVEPRVASRLVEPICELMRRSPAKSVVFECIRTVLTSLSGHESALRLAVEKAKEFLATDEDPNLRYLGLQALSMLPPGQSWAVEDSREVVIKSLTDPDLNIRREALRLITKTVLEMNVVEIAGLLVSYATKSDPEFANEILDAILATCGRNLYELVEDFDWYVALLGEMARNPHCDKGEEIERQLVDIGLRVRDVRRELVRVARDLLIDPALLGNPFLCRVLSAAAWVSGEYAEFLRSPLETVEALLQPRTSLLPMSVRAVYVQAVFKVFAFCFSSYVDQLEARQFSCVGNSSVERGAEEESDAASIGNSAEENAGVETRDGAAAVDKPPSWSTWIEKKEPFTLQSLSYMSNLIEAAVSPMADSDEVEVQERARNVLGMIHILRDAGVWNIEEEDLAKDKRVSEIVELLQAPFSDELGPVSVNAQKKVAVPEGLELKENLAELATVLGEDNTAPSTSISFSLKSHHHRQTREEFRPLAESTSLLAEHRKRHGLYYLPAEKDETGADDYPCANDPLLPVSHGDSSEDLVKLAGQALIPRKPKHTKPRPVVVKLDDGDEIPSSAPIMVKESKDDLLSGAVRDVLLGNEGKPSSSHKKSSDKSTRRRAKDVPGNSISLSQSKENVDLDDREQEISSSRRSRHRTHGKERHKSPEKNEDKGEKGNQNSTRSSHHHGKHKHRQRGHASLNVVPRAPVIQDFLL